MRSCSRLLAALAVMCGLWPVQTPASPFEQPWHDPSRALVIDAYEFNAIAWDKLVTDKRIVGFIGKASDGLSEPYACSGNETERLICKTRWRRYVVTRELYHTRRTLAKALGLKWGAYHLARPGNPVAQADHFIDFAEPAADDLIALDIEGIDPGKWMSLADAEIFARRIEARLGRWPVLYTNGATARHIAANMGRYPVLSRLPLWYARFAPSISGHFPKGNWQSYDLWQFAASANCSARRCPYRPPGTPLDIDVNVADMTPEALRAAWPLDGLKPVIAPDEDSAATLVAEAGPIIARLAAEGSLRVPLPHAAPRANAAYAGITFTMADDLPLMPSAFAETFGLQREALGKARAEHGHALAEKAGIDQMTTAAIPLAYPHPGGIGQDEADRAFAAMSERQKPSAQRIAFTPE